MFYKESDLEYLQRKVHKHGRVGFCSQNSENKLDEI